MSQHFTAKTEMARTYDVNAKTIYEWMGKPGFPKKGAHGWSRVEVTKWVESHRKSVAERAAGAGDKAELTMLQCDKLRVLIQKEEENLKQAQIETAKQQGKLHAVSTCEAEWDRAGSVLRGAVDSWQAHNVAKSPDMKVEIDGLCASFLAALEGLT